MVILGFVAGMVAVLIVAAALLSTSTPTDQPEPVVLQPSFPPVDHDNEAAIALIDAWARWRTATFVSSGTWTRTLDGLPESPLSGDVYTAQDPPRRFQIRLGSEIDRTDDPDRFQRDLVNELALVGSWVTGQERGYDVAFGADGCFIAELEVAALASPWGRWAEYCFDEDTGALRSARVRRQSAVDTENHTVIRAEVTDADFG